jgi:hypothetical protein
MQAQEAATQNYIRSAASNSGSAAEEIATAASLRDSGVISEGEFAALKARAMA